MLLWDVNKVHNKTSKFLIIKPELKIKVTNQMYFAYAYGIQARIGHASNIPKMQFFTGISINTQSKSFMPSLSECVWEF